MNNNYFESAEFREIQEAYEQYLKNDKSTYLDADDFADVADYYLSCDDVEQARTAVEGGLAQHPDDEVLLTEKVAIYIYEHRFGAARRCLDKYALDDNDNFYQRAQLCFALDHDNKQAQAMFREWMAKELAEVDKSELDFVERDAYMHIISSFVELGDNSLENEPVLIIIKKWIDEYIDKFQPLGRFESDLQIMDICRHNNLAEQLVSGLTQVLDEQPYLTGGWSSLALAHFTLNQFEQAIEASDFALAINADDTGALLTRAYAHMSLNQREEACKFFERYFSKPNMEEVQYIPYADCLARIKQEEKARTFIEKGLNAILKEYENHVFDNGDYSMRYAQALFDAAGTYQLLNDYSSAETCMHHLLAAMPDDEDALFMLGNMQLAQGDDTEALNTYGEAISKSRDHVKMAIDIALTLVMNNYDEFALEVVEALESQDKKLRIHNHAMRHLPAIKALVYLKMGNAYQFISNFKLAIDQTPELVKNVFSGYFPEGMEVEDYLDYAMQKLKE